jgi:antibiotic biosynthesis monooxygenase (ABM) superfamily enzyme
MTKRSVENPDAPSRLKMALLTWAAAFPLLTALNVVFGPHLAALPLPVRTLLLTGIMVGLLTYVIMPRLTRGCAGWLLRPSAGRRQDASGRRRDDAQPMSNWLSTTAGEERR